LFYRKDAKDPQRTAKEYRLSPWPVATARGSDFLFDHLTIMKGSAVRSLNQTVHTAEPSTTVGLLLKKYGSISARVSSIAFRGESRGACAGDDGDFSNVRFAQTASPTTHSHSVSPHAHSQSARSLLRQTAA